jgi:hypothetical protein
MTRKVVMHPSPAQRAILNGLLSGFRMLGPIESVVWLADYFNGYAEEMIRTGHAHGDHAKNVAELVVDLRALVAKYKARSQ